MSGFEIDLEDPPERWRELYAWLEAGAERGERSAGPAAPAVSAPVALDPGATIALYAAYLAGEL
jgi:hypothetical protein